MVFIIERNCTQTQFSFSSCTFLSSNMNIINLVNVDGVFKCIRNECCSRNHSVDHFFVSYITTYLAWTLKLSCMLKVQCNLLCFSSVSFAGWYMFKILLSILFSMITFSFLKFAFFKPARMLPHNWIFVHYKKSELVSFCDASWHPEANNGWKAPKWFGRNGSLYGTTTNFD